MIREGLVPESPGGGGASFGTPPAVTRLGTRPPADPTGWLMTEKMDGIFARWNGTAFVTLGGWVLDAPKRLSRGLGAHLVDGELWAQRGNFGVVVAAHRLNSENSRWDSVDFYPFDVDAPGDFVTRTRPIRRRLVRSIRWESLDQELERIRKAGGEGVVLRDQLAEYARGRTSSVVKYKCKTEQQSKVVQILDDGRVKLESGVSFRTSAQLGDTVKYTITGFSDQGVQRGARLLT